MDQDLRVRERIALALRAAGKEEGAHAGSHADTDRGDIALDELHGVIDGKPCGDGSSRAVDVELDILIRILSLEEEELRDNKFCGLVCDLAAQHDDPLLQETGKDVVGALTGTGLLNHIGNVVSHVRMLPF